MTTIYATHRRAQLMWRGALVSLLAVGALSLAGCGLSTPYPSRALYTLSATAPETPTHPQAHKDITLRVRRIVAIAPFNATSFDYRDSATSIRTDYYNTFAATPADLLTAQLTRWLSASHIFAAVVDSGVNLPNQWALEGRIQELSVDVSHPQKPQAVITMQLLLLDESGVVTRVLSDKTYTERTDLPPPTRPARRRGGRRRAANYLAKLRMI